jgi:hypothetical protein
MKNKALILGLVILVILSAGCLSSKESPPPEKAQLGEVKIQADQSTYSSTMSSAPGIGLTPLWTLGRPAQDFNFHWHYQLRLFFKLGIS